MAGWGRRFRIAIQGKDPRANIPGGKPFIWHFFQARPGGGASSAGDGWPGGGEWQAVSQLLRGRGGKALDVGAGRGIASYALARDGKVVTFNGADASPSGTGTVLTRVTPNSVGLGLGPLGSDGRPAALYFALPDSISRIDLPQLRERPDDVPALAMRMERLIRASDHKRQLPPMPDVEV